MTGFERTYLVLEPLLPPLYGLIRRRLGALVRETGRDVASVLDVGGRKSHYTIGIRADVTITDVPRATELQKRLHLGIDASIRDLTLTRRSNVRAIVFDDMTKTELPAESFDCAVAVEVLEHIDEDEVFVKNVSRLLRPGGHFLMSTPNGDAIPHVTNPDHRRHYTRAQLTSLLRRYFDGVTTEYAIRQGTFQRMGLQSWSPRRPVRTVMSMSGNLVNALQSFVPDLSAQVWTTQHLVAVGRKSASQSGACA